MVYKLSFSQKSFYLKNVDYEFGLLVDGAPSQSKYVALAPESQQVNKFGRMNWYGAMSGTSMSTPHVAGIITLWMQAKPTLTVNEILLPPLPRASTSIRAARLWLSDGVFITMLLHHSRVTAL